MVSIKAALQNAMVFARNALGIERTQGLRLEEIESRDNAWLITLSMYITNEGPASGIGEALRAIYDQKREYKTFAVDKETGEVTSMKIRILADA
jgi:hypothetical protein